MSDKRLPIKVSPLEAPVSERDLRAIYGLSEQLTSRPLDPEAVYRNVQEEAANPSQELLVARRAGHIAGMATLTIKTTPIERTGYIDALVVSKKHRRQGIARHLATWITGFADERRLTLQLTSRSSRPEAILLYKSLGFTQRETNFFERRPRNE